MTRFFGITIVRYTESKKTGNSNKKKQFLRATKPKGQRG
jgi:hypothetical protein